MYIDRSMIGWIESLRRVGGDHSARQILANAAGDFESLEALGLPCLDSRMFLASEFDQRIAQLHSEFLYERYFLVLTPILPGLTKYIYPDCPSLDKAEEFIFEKLGQLSRQYTVKLFEFEPNVYGGTIICNNDIVIVEMAEGIQSEVAYGTVKVISACLTNFQISTRYSTSNSDQRELLWAVLKAISRTQEALLTDLIENRETIDLRGYHFLKGYFEFVYTQSVARKGLRLAFLEANKSDLYCNINKLL